MIEITLLFLNDIKSKGLKAPWNFDSSSGDYNPNSVVKFLTTVGNLMVKESARINMGDISGVNITDIPMEGNSNQEVSNGSPNENASLEEKQEFYMQP